jgi:hypothetical protein
LQPERRTRKVTLWGGFLTKHSRARPVIAAHAGVPSLAKPRSARLSFTVRSHMQLRYRILVSIAGAAALTLLTAFLSSAFASASPRLASVLFWPNTLLQSAVGCAQLRVGAKVFCEGTPLNVLAYWTSFPLGVLVYGIAAYALLGRLGMTSNQRLERP